MKRLVKQIRVVISCFYLILVKIIENQILIERLLFTCKNVFRYDPLNRMYGYYKAVPFCKLNLPCKTGGLSQGADHVRVNNFLLKQRLQIKYTFSIMHKIRSIGINCSFFQKRYYMCKAYNNYIKYDNNVINIIGQNVRNNSTTSQGSLYLLKAEIKQLSKNLTPLIVRSIKQNIWPMLKFNNEIKFLVKKRQKYLALLSNKYGLRSITVMRQVEEWLCQVDLRVLAIETVYRSRDNLTAGVDNQVLKRENLIDHFCILKHNKLKFYKSDPVKRIYIPKKNSFELRPLGIPTIKDRIMQTLFVQILEPIIDPHADYYSFGYRKGRNAHQAIGVLSKSLGYKTKSSKKKKHSDKRYFLHSKFIINIDVEKFFEKVDHKWLLQNYPFPAKFIHILKNWLSSEIIFQNEHEVHIYGFPQGSVIGPSLANFTLNGLEQVIIPSKKTAFDAEKFNYYLRQGFLYKKNDSKVRKSLSSVIVRYVDDFIVVINDKFEAEIMYDKIKLFLKQRGLKLNLTKSKIFKWEHNAKFNYLGFTFHYILKKKVSQITVQWKLNKSFIRGGLYVYPSKIKVQEFKKKIKTVILKNINVSPFRLIKIINPIITGWANYFGIGTLRIFSRLDHFIYYRLWRYLRRKFKRVPTNKLVERYFQGIDTPSGRIWQFHGIFKNIDKNKLKRKGSVAWIVLLTKLNKPVPAHMFSPSDNLIEAIYFVDEKIFNNYNTNIINLRGGKTYKNFNNWSSLYTKQKGVCDICKLSLGYLTIENLEIHHLKRVADLDVDDPLLNDIKNLSLVHKSCHKTTLKVLK